MNQSQVANINDRDDQEEGILPVADRLVQAKRMLSDLAETIGVQPASEFFSDAPAPATAEDVLQQMARIEKYIKTGKY